ncbi:MAG: YcxB family protein [Christensenellales bacterium]
MVENLTEYDKNILKNYVTFTSKKSRIVTYIACVVIIVSAIFEFVFKEYVYGAIFLSVGVLFFIFNLLLVNIALKRISRMPKIKNKYQFLPENLIITTYTNETELESTTLSYTAIVKFVENQEVFYLYLNKSQALLVDTTKFASNEDKEIAKRYIKNNNSGLKFD